MIQGYENWICLYLVLLISAFYDIMEQRIPNWWLARSTWLGIGTLLLLEQGGTGHGGRFLLETVVRMAVTLLTVFPLFLFRMMGAGDLKLMVAISGFLDGRDAVGAIAVSFFLGAVWSLFRLLIQKQLKKRLFYLFAYFRHYFLTKKRIPYYEPSRDGTGITIPFGVCLFLGTLVYGIWKIQGA